MILRLKLKGRGLSLVTGSASIIKWVGTAKASTPDVKSLGSKVIKSSNTLVGVGPSPPAFKFQESPCSSQRPNGRTVSSDSLSDSSLSVVKVEKKRGDCSVTLKEVKMDVLPTKPDSSSALDVLVPELLAENMVSNESMNGHGQEDMVVNKAKVDVGREKGVGDQVSVDFDSTTSSFL